MAGWNLALNDRVTCPFNPAHVMNYSKFHNHFVACQRAHPNDPRKQCPYNASELIHPEDMDEHIIHCEWRQHQTFPVVTKKDVWSFDDVPCHIKFGESSQPLRKNGLSSDVDAVESDEEIDSVSVKVEDGPFDPYASQKVSQNSSDSPAAHPPVPTERKGFGRGAFLKKLSSIIRKNTVIDVPVLEKPQQSSVDDSVGSEFSWLCSKNIDRESTDNLPKTSSENSNTESHEETEELVKPLISLEKLYLKLGRSRGALLRERIENEW